MTKQTPEYFLGMNGPTLLMTMYDGRWWQVAGRKTASSEMDIENKTYYAALPSWMEVA